MRLFLAAILFCGSMAGAGVSSSVSPESSFYDQIERLESRRCAYSTFRLLKPQAYGDLRSAIDVGEASPGDDENPQARCDLPLWLRKERDLHLHATQPSELRAQALFLPEDTLVVQGIEASVLPLVPLRSGRPYFLGANTYFELALHGEGGRDDLGIAFSVVPGFLAAWDDYRALKGQLYLQEGYVKVGYKWAELLLGRIAMGFGEAQHGTLLLSDAARPMNLVKFSFRPHLLGRPFRFLGPFTFETWVTDSPEGKALPGSRYWGLAIGVRPLTWLELSLMELYQLGGVGTPSVGLSDLLKMLIYWDDPDLATKRQRAFGLHLGVWGPSQIFKLYSQAYFERLSALSQWFADDISVLLGLWFPRLGEFSLRFELARTTPQAYQHPVWKQGLVYRGTPLGHPLGPDALGFYADLGIPPLGVWRPAVGFHYEQRLRTPGPGQATDKRIGGSLSLARRWERTELSALARYNNTTNERYIPGAETDAWGGFLGLSYSFY